MKPKGHSIAYGSGCPNHWRCRSAEIPVLEMSAVKKVAKPSVFRSIVKGYHAAAVILKLADWFVDLPETEQLHLLGARRLRQVRQGQMPLEQALKLASSKFVFSTKPQMFDPSILHRAVRDVLAGRDWDSSNFLHLGAVDQAFLASQLRPGKFPKGYYGKWADSIDLDWEGVTVTHPTSGLSARVSREQVLDQASPFLSRIFGSLKGGLDTRGIQLNSSRVVFGVRHFSDQSMKFEPGFPEWWEAVRAGGASESYMTLVRGLMESASFEKFDKSLVISLPDILSGDHQALIRRLWDEGSPVTIDRYMASLVVHEYTHAVLETHPNLKALVLKYFEERVRGLPSVDIGDGARLIQGADFLVDYMGHIQGTARGDEFLSTALQLLYLDPNYLVRHDPKTASFLFSLIDHLNTGAEIPFLDLPDYLSQFKGINFAALVRKLSKETAADQQRFMAEVFHAGIEGISPKTLKAIERYAEIDDFSYGVNDLLRQLRMDDLTMDQLIFVRSLDRAMLPSTRDTLVFRGIDDDALGAWGISSTTPVRSLIGMTLTDRGFVSTSIQRNIAEEFAAGEGGFFDLESGGALCRIFLPEGTLCRGLEGYATTSELEVLLARGTEFVVINARRENGRLLLDLAVINQPKTLRSRFDELLDDYIGELESAYTRPERELHNLYYKIFPGQEISDTVGRGGYKVDLDDDAIDSSLLETVDEWVQALYMYSHGESYEMNVFLRSRGVDWDEVLENALLESHAFEWGPSRLAALLDRASRLTTFDKPYQILFRGMDLASLTDWGVDLKVLQQTPSALIGMQLRDRGFVSTSVSSSIFRQFGHGEVELQILTPRGTRVALPRDVSKWPAEWEVILGHNSIFEIVDVQRTTKGYRLVLVLVEQNGVDLTTP